jgi:LTXXQ motif family protein
MKRFSKKAVAAGAFVTALGGTLLAFPLILDNQALALDTGGSASASGQDRHHFRLPSERIEPRLAYLKTALKITDAQSKQWNAFADVLRKQAKARDAKVEEMRAKFEANKGKPNQDVSAIDRMERREKMMTDAAASLSEVLAAAKPLYASLSDEQKQTADELLGGRSGRGGWGGRHFGHGGFGGGPERG